MKEKLWQTIEKEHIESMTGESITDEEWEMFVNALQDAFADEVSALALEFWRDYNDEVNA
jgi:ubiquinone biosynthesis protein UbiJ|tara:strand:- start:243 stop:422 length:180 start_codon:yes stop_codon:yes gene_type:complete